MDFKPFIIFTESVKDGRGNETDSNRVDYYPPRTVVCERVNNAKIERSNESRRTLIYSGICNATGLRGPGG